LVEIKNPLGRNRLTKEQEEFIASWDGEIHVCSTVDEAVNAVVNGANEYIPISGGAVILKV
jgi:hypothetical protein